jgi:hypothetical protein
MRHEKLLQTIGITKGLLQPGIDPINGIKQQMSEKMQTLSAEPVTAMRKTVLPEEKELTAEIEWTRSILQDRKRILFTSPEATRTKKNVKIKRAPGGRKWAKEVIG